MSDKIGGDFVSRGSIERRIRRLDGLIRGLESTMKAARYVGRLAEFKAELNELTNVADAS